MLSLAGLILTATGLLVTFSTWTVDGWTVLALVGVGMLHADQRPVPDILSTDDPLPSTPPELE